MSCSGLFCSSASCGGRAADAVARVGEHEEEAAAHRANHEREALHHLVHLLPVAGEEAPGDPVVGERDGHEHERRHDGVQHVDEAEPELVLPGHLHDEPRPEQRQHPRRDEAVVHPAVGRAEAVGEVERKQEAAQSARRALSMATLTAKQEPSQEAAGRSISKVRSVPVGRKLASMDVLERVLWTPLATARRFLPLPRGEPWGEHAGEVRFRGAPSRISTDKSPAFLSMDSWSEYVRGTIFCSVRTHSGESFPKVVGFLVLYRGTVCARLRTLDDFEFE